MATPDEIDLAESEICRLIEVAKQQGLNSWEILGIFLKACDSLYLAAECEYRVKAVNNV